MNLFAASAWWWVVLGVLAAEAAVVVALPALGQRRVHSAAGRRTLWQLAALALLVLPLAEFGGVGREVAHWLDSRIEARRLPPSESRPVPAVHRPVDVVPLTAAPRTRDLVEPERPLPLMPPPRIEPPGHLARHWPAWVWLIGCGLLVGRLASQHGAFLAHRRRHHRQANAILVERVSLLARKLGITRRVQVVESDKLSSPIAFGLFRPAIGLPASFAEQFTPAQQDAMLAHELAHLAAGDAAWQLLADLATAVWWWHPMAWWARRQLQSASEVAADEASLVVRNGPAALAESLVKLGAQLTTAKSSGGLGIEGRGFRSGLGRRVERLLRLDGETWRAPRRWKTFLARTIGPTLLVLAAVLCSAWAWPQSMLAGETPFNRLRQSWRGMTAAVVPGTPVNDVTAAFKGGTPNSETLAMIPQFQQTNTTAGRTNEVPKRWLTPSETSSKARQALLAKMEKITIPEMFIDGLPLSEVVRLVADECKRQDPQKKGINFILNPFLEPPPLRPTGPGVTPAPPQRIDLKSVIITIKPPVMDIPLSYALYAICKMADQPIQFIVEDDAIVFAPKAKKPPQMLEAQTGEKPAQRTPQTYTGAQIRNLIDGIERLRQQGQVNSAEAVVRQLQEMNPGDKQLKATLNNIQGQQKQLEVLARLDQIVFGEIGFDQKPLKEVVAFLTAAANRNPPTSERISFSLEPRLLSTPQTGSRAPAAENRANWEQATVTVRPPRHNVTFLELLQAVVQGTHVEPGVRVSFMGAGRVIMLIASQAPGAGTNGGNRTEVEIRNTAAELLHDAVRLYHEGNFSEASYVLHQIWKADSSNHAARYYQDLVRCAQHGTENRTVKETNSPANKSTTPLSEPAVLPKPLPEASPRTAAPNTSSKARQKLLAKLDQIQVGEVFFDGLPLEEVVKWLRLECLKHDPEKKGMNFIINPFLNKAPPSPGAATNRAGQTSPPLLDAFGNPIAIRPQTPGTGLGSVLIKINPSLKELTLRQALDVICKMANQPIQYIVEDYAVVFLPGPANRFPRIYKTDPNTFKQGLEGVRPAPLPGPGNNNPRQP